MGEFAVGIEIGPSGPARNEPAVRAEIEDVGESLDVSPHYLVEPPHGRLADRLEHALGELPANLRAIISKLPDVDSWSVQAGFPLGVNVTVTFKGGGGHDST
jgi:hypothetical protein